MRAPSKRLHWVEPTGRDRGKEKQQQQQQRERETGDEPQKNRDTEGFPDERFCCVIRPRGSELLHRFGIHLSWVFMSPDTVVKYTFAL